MEELGTKIHYARFPKKWPNFFLKDVKRVKRSTKIQYAQFPKNDRKKLIFYQKTVKTWKTW